MTALGRVLDMPFALRREASRVVLCRGRPIPAPAMGRSARQTASRTKCFSNRCRKRALFRCVSIKASTACSSARFEALTFLMKLGLRGHELFTSTESSANERWRESFHSRLRTVRGTSLQGFASDHAPNRRWRCVQGLAAELLPARATAHAREYLRDALWTEFSGAVEQILVHSNRPRLPQQRFALVAPTLNTTRGLHKQLEKRGYGSHYGKADPKMSAETVTVRDHGSDRSRLAGYYWVDRQHGLSCRADPGSGWSSRSSAPSRTEARSTYGARSRRAELCADLPTLLVDQHSW